MSLARLTFLLVYNMGFYYGTESDLFLFFSYYISISVENLCQISILIIEAQAKQSVVHLYVCLLRFAFFEPRAFRRTLVPIYQRNLKRDL